MVVGFAFTFGDARGWLSGAIAWHLAMAWVLVGNAAVYLAYGLLSGHFVRSLLPLTLFVLHRAATEL